MIALAERTTAGNRAPYRRERLGNGYTSSIDTLSERFENEQTRLIDALVDFFS